VASCLGLFYIYNYTMKNIMLNYIALNSDEDAALFPVKSAKHLIDVIDIMTYGTRDVVWVFAVGSEVIVTDKKLFLQAALLGMSKFLMPSISEDCFLQEYASFEDAYAVALSMREPNPLCYEKEE